MALKKPSSEKLKAQGARIRQVIEASGKLQTEVCAAIGVEPHTMNRWLNGKNSARAHFEKLGIVLNVSAKWLEDGDGPKRDDRADIIARFIEEEGPKMKPPLNSLEAAYLLATPNHRVTIGSLRDAIDDVRYDLPREEKVRSVEVTEAVRKKGDALGVPRKKKR